MVKKELKKINLFLICKKNSFSSAEGDKEISHVICTNLQQFLKTITFLESEH